jgi:hypothetical protein
VSPFQFHDDLEPVLLFLPLQLMFTNPLGPRLRAGFQAAEAVEYLREPIFCKLSSPGHV